MDDRMKSRAIASLRAGCKLYRQLLRQRTDRVTPDNPEGWGYVATDDPAGADEKGRWAFKATPEMWTNPPAEGDPTFEAFQEAFPLGPAHRAYPFRGDDWGGSPRHVFEMVRDGLVVAVGDGSGEYQLAQPVRSEPNG